MELSKKLSLSTSVALLGSMLFANSLFAEDKAPVKAKLKGNMDVEYKILPQDVDTFSAMFENGITYGRLRMNTFMWDWADKDSDNHALGLGGSLVYKTATFNGFSGTVGLYTSQNPFYYMNREDVGDLKAGKDTLSRYKVKQTGDYGISVLGQAYLQYTIKSENKAVTEIKAGRQIFSSVFTKANDTKMIPNTFDGLVIENKNSVANTKFQFAYLFQQKLRDHTNVHDVLTFKDSSGESWANNDDSAIHKGLSYANFKSAGKETNHDLIIATVKNQSVDNLTAIASYYQVPEVVSNLTLEGYYKIPVNQGWNFEAGARYMMQMDNGGGEIGGASLSGTVNKDNAGGYSDPESLASSLLAIRGVMSSNDKIAKFLVGYSKIDDKADIIAPWRGFPTGGYTRAMGQYNWRANTTTYMIQGVYNLGKAKMIEGLTVNARYAMQDFDEDKGFYDSNILHIDLVKDCSLLDNFQTKVRFATVDHKGSDSYNEYRLEFNYLF